MRIREPELTCAEQPCLHLPVVVTEYLRLKTRGPFMLWVPVAAKFESMALASAQLLMRAMYYFTSWWKVESQEATCEAQSFCPLLVATPVS